MPEKEEPMYTNSLKVFAGMNIEEYLYNLKFEEISSKIAATKRQRNKKVFIYGGALVVIIGAIAALYLLGMLEF